MTPTMQKTYKFIDGYIAAKGHSPSFQDILEGTGIRSKSAIHRVVGQLEERGFIRRSIYRARSIEIVKRNCPHCGGCLG